MSYSKLCKKPLIFRSFTGVTVSEFESIFNEIEHNYEEHERRRLLSRMMTKKKKRIRDIGAGRPFKLKVKERFVMLLVYYRLYITYIHYQDFYLTLIKAMFVERYIHDEITYQGVYSIDKEDIQTY
jgi:hypothetical protein